VSTAVNFDLAVGPRPDVVSAAAGRARSALFRLAKLGGAAGVLAVGAYGLLSEQGYVVSDSAVVTAQRVVVRAPIEGYAQDVNARVGGLIAKGEVLGRVENPRVDDQHLTALAAQLARARADADSARATRDAPLRLKSDLRRRADMHSAASQARVAGLQAEAQSSLMALEAARQQAKVDLDRKLQLGRDGVASVAELDKARTAFTVATETAEGQRGRLTSLQAEAIAIGKGVLAESGANDVAYSMQRMDEIDLRLAELDRIMSLAQSEADATAAQLAAEERRVALLRNAVVTAPHAGVVWKLGAADGERVAPGDPIAETVDCSAGFILAGIPQKRLSAIAVGSEARVRLAGETADRTGRVLSVSGDKADDRGLAALPPSTDGSEATARIQLSNPDSGECLIGRSARVLIPAAGDGLLRQALSRLS
jgi:multidrug resistance efflux pump